MSIRSFFIFLLACSTKLSAQQVVLYDLDLTENNQKESIAFVSLSDNYTLSEHPDSSAIPSLKDKKEKDAQYLKLTGIYRKRLLTAMKIAEEDKVFIYDYSLDTVTSILVKQLDVVACINVYGADWPYSQSDYMIGFEIDRKYVKAADVYYRYSLVYVGKENPFVTGQMKPVKWEKLDPKNKVVIPINAANQSWIRKHKYSGGNIYSFTKDSLQYFIKEFTSYNQVTARHLSVMRLGTKKLICERLYYDHESASLAPLNYTEPGAEINQWTGKLLKNKPSVIFGFQYISFGCPAITFLNPSTKDMYISCDNRH